MNTDAGDVSALTTIRAGILDLIDGGLFPDPPAHDERAQRRAARFRAAWSHVMDYRLMLEFVLEDWRDRAAAAAQRLDAKLEAMLAANEPSGSRVMTAQEEAELWAQMVEHLRLRLAEESFYLFANILLDRAALAVKHTLFAGGHRDEPQRHSALAKDLAQLAAAARLTHPGDRLLELAGTLETELSDFRDRVTAHPIIGDVRTHMGFSGKIGSPEMSLAPSIVHPTKAEREGGPLRPQPTARLALELDEYLVALIAWVRANLDDED